MSDTLLRAIARDAGIQICAASTTELVERAHEIHNTTPLATAALGRTLTATAIMGSQLKVEDGSVTVQIKGNGPLGAIVCVGDSDGYVRGYLQDPAVDLPLRADGKLNVGGGVGRGYLMVIKDIGLKDPITGTVALVNGEIAEDLTRYFCGERADSVGVRARRARGYRLLGQVRRRLARAAYAGREGFRH